MIKNYLKQGGLAKALSMGFLVLFTIYKPYVGYIGLAFVFLGIDTMLLCYNDKQNQKHGLFSYGKRLLLGAITTLFGGVSVYLAVFKGSNKVYMLFPTLVASIVLAIILLGYRKHQQNTKA